MSTVNNAGRGFDGLRKAGRRDVISLMAFGLAGASAVASATSGAPSSHPITGDAVVNGLDARVIVLKPGETLPIEDERSPHVVIPMSGGHRVAIVSDGPGAIMADRMNRVDEFYATVGHVPVDRARVERDALGGIIPA